MIYCFVVRNDSVFVFRVVNESHHAKDVIDSVSSPVRYGNSAVKSGWHRFFARENRFFDFSEHLFPLLGFGPASVLRGCIWVLGASAGVCCPLLSAGGPPRRRMLLSLLAAFFLAAAAALAAAWLMPVYALAAPRTVGWRMLLVTHMTPSVPCWSVQVALVTLLLLLSLAVSVRRAAAFAASSFGVERKAGNHWAETLFLLLLIPFSAMQTESVRAFLVTAGPLRFPCMAAAAVGSYAAGRRRK